MEHNHLPIDKIRHEGLPDSTNPVNGGDGAEAQPHPPTDELGAFIGSSILEHYDSTPIQTTRPDEQARAAEEWRETYPIHGWSFRPWAG